jgi:hypothetical protein
MVQGTRTVKDAICSALDCLVAALSLVLLLLMGLRLPTFDTKVAENILNFVADENLSIIAKKFMWCTTVCDVIFQGIDKLLICVSWLLRVLSGIIKSILNDVSI